MSVTSLGARAATLRPGSHEWETPLKLFAALDAEFTFTVDGASLEHNAKLPRFWTPYDSGLEHDWRGERVFVNPPFGNEIGHWTRKAKREQARGCELAVLLVPVRSDTSWWHESVLGCAEIRFLRGRVTFEQRGVKSGRAPFPCCLLIYRGLSGVDYRGASA